MERRRYQIFLFPRKLMMIDEIPSLFAVEEVLFGKPLRPLAAAAEC